MKIYMTSSKPFLLYSASLLQYVHSFPLHMSFHDALIASFSTHATITACILIFFLSTHFLSLYPYLFILTSLPAVGPLQSPTPSNSCDRGP